MTVSRSFDHDPAAVREARRFVSEHLADAEPDVRERAVLLVSELTSNAVRHAGTGFEVSVEARGSDFLVEVSDAGPGEPVVQERDRTRPAGRGLQLVEDLSGEWGVRRHGSNLKTIWFTI